MESARSTTRRFTSEQADEIDVEKANETASVASTLFSMMQSPASGGFFLGQKLALEGARFWARRMRAYADQMERLARCTSPDQVAEANSQFIERMQSDYAEERAAVSEIVVLPKFERGEGDRTGA